MWLASVGHNVYNAYSFVCARKNAWFRLETAHFFLQSCAPMCASAMLGTVATAATVAMNYPSFWKHFLNLRCFL